MGSAATRSRPAGRASGDPASRWTRRLVDNAWVARGLRIGMGARGAAYLVLAYLVARIAFGALGHGGTNKPASGPGIAQALAAQDGGRSVLALLAVGLALYALFSAVDALIHHDGESPAAKRWGDRALSAWGAVVYGAFSAYAFATVRSGASRGDSSEQSRRQHSRWSSEVLRWPGGRVYIGLIAAVLFVIAGFLISRAIRRSFSSRLDRDAMGARTWRFAMVCGTVGCAGRAGIFGLAGGFVMRAAIEDDPHDGQGVDGALRLFAADRAGAYALGMLAAALAGYALYLLVEARFRRI